jgi:uncharacterized protein (TIGR02145 family)
MKKTISICLLVFTISLFFSCKKDEPAKLAVVSTTSVSNLTATNATSGGNVTSDGGAAVIAKGVCWGIVAEPSTSDSKTSDGTATGQFVSEISGLTGGTTYHLRAYATNSVGTAYGEDLSFVTLGKVPSSTIQPVTNVSVEGATLNGSVNANDLSTSVTFEYGTTITYGSTVTAPQSPVTGNTVTSISAVISGLSAGTTYHFRIKTINSLGTTYSNDATFTTSGQVPVGVTIAATNILSTVATLNGSVNASNLSTAISFEYGTTLSYGSTVAATPNILTGNINTNVIASISGLSGGMTYHFRVKAVNSLGTTYGNDLTFITLGQLPTAVTTAATNVGTTSAILNGSVNANYLSTDVTFEYGTSLSYGSNATATQSPVTGNTTTNLNVAISGLTAGTTYHFRVKAVNSLGTTYGSDLTFTYTVTDSEGNIYSIVTIGTQIWMKENLKTTKFSNGENITESYAYNNDNSNVATYGRLYTWYAVNDSRKICPASWHVASQSEFTSLSSRVASSAEFKEAGTVHWQTPNTGATNSIGFTALPGGYYTGSIYIYLYQQACFWLSDQASATLGIGAALYYNNLPTPGDLLNWPKGRALSVRCVKD